MFFLIIQKSTEIFSTLSTLNFYALSEPFLDLDFFTFIGVLLSPSALISSGFLVFTVSLFIITLAISSLEGISNIISFIVSSIIALKPLAPVFLLIASFAIASKASSSNSKFYIIHFKKFLILLNKCIFRFFKYTN